MATRLEKLLEKEAQLKAQIQQAKAVERTLEKKRDTRRKILIGAAVMARVERGEWPQQDLLKMMDGFLTRPHERVLFDLNTQGEDGSAQKTKGTNKKPNQSGAAKATAQPKKTVMPLPQPNSNFDDEFDDL